MAPIVLKVKGNMQTLSFAEDASEDLSKTWRVCTKVKDSLENGSRLENLSWRLWFAHNVSDKKATPVSPGAASLLRNFKVPDDFDFKAQKKRKTHAKLEADYRRKLSLQQKKQAEQKLQNNNRVIATPSSAMDLNVLEFNQLPQQKEFTLHQFTSDQAGDQIIELEDIFKSFSGDMQSYLNPSEESPTSQQLDNLINQSWPLSSNTTSCSNGSYSYQNYATDTIMSTNTSPINLSFPASTMTHPSNMYSQQQQEYSNYNGYHENNNNNNNHNNNHNNNTLQDTALYVSSEETMPPIPIGTLHNKLLTTLPKETLETAGKLFSTSPNAAQKETMNYHPSMIQSTPTTPYITASSHFSQNHQVPMEESSSFYHYPIQPPTKSVTPTASTSFTFSHQHQHHYHHQNQSKSLPPSRAASPPPCDITGSSSSASSSPVSVISSSSSSPTTQHAKRSNVAINSSPAEGKAPVCSNCSTTSTPLWRRSANDELLCNACGLYLKLHNAPRPKYLKPQSSRKDVRGEEENTVQPLCSNCGTSTTPLWRRDLDGAPLCNACGLYLKLHHEKRPLSMKTDNIKKRQRCDNTNNSSSNSSNSSNSGSNSSISGKLASSLGNAHLAGHSKRRNRAMEEPLTTTVTFDSKFQRMEDVVQTNPSAVNPDNSNFSPFGSFGLTLTHQPI